MAATNTIVQWRCGQAWNVIGAIHVDYVRQELPGIRTTWWRGVGRDAEPSWSRASSTSSRPTRSKTRLPTGSPCSRRTAFGLSAALHGEITIKDGRVEQSNFGDYRVLRINRDAAD
jgi:hypothetical protein